MPPNRHAVLSASSSHRWLHCNPSARLELEFEDRETEAASEGTAAHALAEHKLRKALKMRSTRPVSKYDSDEMEMYTDSYLEFVLEAIEEARQDCPDFFQRQFLLVSGCGGLQLCIDSRLILQHGICHSLNAVRQGAKILDHIEQELDLTHVRHLPSELR